jgi:uncharacterized membrane protein
MPAIEESIEVEAPVSTAYNQWTQFEKFPHFMDAEITEQQPDERIAWKSTGGKGNAGVVTSHRLDNQCCKIMLQLDWEAEGMLGKVRGMLGHDDRQVTGDLNRFKELTENRRNETGAWRGQVHHGEATTS